MADERISGLSRDPDRDKDQKLLKHLKVSKFRRFSGIKRPDRIPGFGSAATSGDRREIDRLVALTMSRNLEQDQRSSNDPTPGKVSGDSKDQDRSKGPSVSKDDVFETLRREILAARLKVTLDKELQRTTPPIVVRLANMKVPPVRSSYRHGDEGRFWDTRVSDQYPPMK